MLPATTPAFVRSRTRKAHIIEAWYGAIGVSTGGSEVNDTQRKYKTDERTRERCLANYHKAKGQLTKAERLAKKRTEIAGMTRAERKAQVWQALATSGTATEERGQTQHHLS